MPVTSTKLQASVLERSRKMASALPGFAPQYEFELGLSESFDELLAADFEAYVREPRELLAVAKQSGRVLVSAEAGAGKSSFGARLLQAGVEQGDVALRVDLRRVTPEFDDKWARREGADSTRMQLLLEALAEPQVDESLLRAAASDNGCVLLVDGLNEVPRRLAATVPFVLDQFAARSPWAAVIVLDRLTRRPLPSDSWTLATITGVTDPEREDEQSFDNALILNIAEDRPPDSTTEAGLLLAHVGGKAKLGPHEMDVLAKAAFALYMEDEARLFRRSALERLVGGDLVSRLISGEVLREDGDYAYFWHHLIHDVLVAHFLVSSRDLWQPDAFDVATFHATSFDALALALELIQSRQEADEFITAVYDWNYYASAYAVARGRRLGTAAVTPATELALLAMLAERRWDPFAVTAQAVEDALRVFPGELRKRLLDARSKDEVFERVAAEVAEIHDPVDWSDIYLERAGLKLLIDRLRGQALTGWMASNVLRRHPLDADTEKEIVNLTRSGERVVRWRAVHVLGANPTERSLEALLGRLDRDLWEWVRYGSIRSIVEIAARSEDLRERALQSVRERLDKIVKHPRLRKELEDALLLQEPPSGWVEAVAPIVEDLWAMAPTVHDQDHWRRVGHRIELSATPEDERIAA
jgi:hypothetical protein